MFCPLSEHGGSVDIRLGEPCGQRDAIAALFGPALRSPKHARGAPMRWRKWRERWPWSEKPLALAISESERLFVFCLADQPKVSATVLVSNSRARLKRRCNTNWCGGIPTDVFKARAK